VFSYLFKPSTCNAIHAFPVGRRGLFITNYLAGYVLLTVPQLIGFAVSIPGIYITSKQFGAILLLQIVSIFAESFVFYTTGVLAVMLAGNIFAGTVIYFIINFFTVAIESVANVVLTRLGYGLSFSGDFTFGIFSFSPITEFITYKLAAVFSATDLLTANEVVDLTSGSVLADVWSAYYPRVAVLCGVSVVFGILSYIFYKIRKLECAGDMVAFRIEIPVISVIVLFVGGALMSMAVCVFIPFKIIGFVLAFIILSFACFIGCEMVLNKTPKVFSVKNIILWAVSCAVIIAGLYALSVYKTNYTPDPEKVEEIKIITSYDIHITDEDEMKAVERFRKELIKNARKNNHKDKDGEDSGLFEFLGDIFYDNDYNVSFFYKLKDGSMIMRTYGFDKEEKELVKALNDFERKHPPESVFDKLEGVDFEITDVSIMNWYWDTGEGDYPEIPKKDYEKILDASRDYVEEQLDGYITEPVNTDDESDYSDENDEDENISFYDVTFECRVNDEESKKKFEKLDEYIYDEGGARMEKQTEYSEDGWRATESHSFTLTVTGIPSDTELFKLLDSYAKSKATA
jgi:hypothetical protein